jgi:hypothetical protein
MLPEVVLNPAGNLEISGRIINDHLCNFFQPLFNWASNCSCTTIHLDIKLEYLNSNGTFLLVEFIHRLEENSSVRDIEVAWHYEEDDDEHYELGDILKNKLRRARFRFLSLV